AVFLRWLSRLHRLGAFESESFHHCRESVEVARHDSGEDAALVWVRLVSVPEGGRGAHLGVPALGPGGLRHPRIPDELARSQADAPVLQDAAGAEVDPIKPERCMPEERAVNGMTPDRQTLPETLAGPGCSALQQRYGYHLAFALELEHPRV